MIGLTVSVRQSSSVVITDFGLSPDYTIGITVSVFCFVFANAASQKNACVSVVLEWRLALRKGSFGLLVVSLSIIWYFHG